MFGFLRKRRAEPQERYELKAVLRLDTSELDAALAKAEELEVTLKRARTLAGELARVTRSLRLNVEVDAYTAEEAIFYKGPKMEQDKTTLNALSFYNRLVKDGVLTDEPIRLFSCESGKYPGGLAQQFANVSGKKVLAPIGTVYNDEKGYVVVADDDDEAAIKFAEAYKKKQRWSMDGWKEFTPKE